MTSNGHCHFSVRGDSTLVVLVSWAPVSVQLAERAKARGDASKAEHVVKKPFALLHPRMCLWVDHIAPVIVR